jgi:ATPase subunit of ABC transporter with duplicated ATPase domains
MIAIHLDGVTVSYVDAPIFADLSWDVHDDRCVGLVGANGSGKSTLLKLMAGHLPRPLLPRPRRHPHHPAVGWGDH